MAELARGITRLVPVADVVVVAIDVAVRTLAAGNGMVERRVLARIVARIAGVDLPRRKHVAFALPYIYGIGKSNAKVICKKAGVDPSKKVEELTDSEVKSIREAIEAEFKVDVLGVRVLTVKPKQKRRGRRQMGTVPGWRKAVVTIAEGQKIELFETV